MVQFARVQSPSSINTYKQCPRRYYYSYIRKLKTLPSIHLIRGKVVHSALEDFFKLNIDHISSDGYEFELRVVLNELFKKHWQASVRALNSLGLSPYELKHYYDESLAMINTFNENFCGKLKKYAAREGFKAAFRHLAPETERHYASKDHGVRGFIDAIHKIEGEVVLMDYKTSKKAEISEPYKLQLAIYALLYEEKHGELPSKVGINFLKFDEQTIAVDMELVNFAREEVALIHENTQSVDVVDYPKQISGLCKWRSGQCDFYDTCVVE